jgi:DNA-binding transcriptional LysR family regulator
MSLDRLAGISVFARVVEANGFTAAARALGLSKAAVSKQVARLEDRLGVRLLNRSTRRLGLTEAGRDFYERAQRVLAELDEAEQAATSRQVNPRGLLRVNAPVTFGVGHLCSLLPDFMRRYPEIKLDLVLNDRYVDLIDEGFDLAVRVGLGPLPDSSLVARRLFAARHAVCAAPAYLERRGVPRTPADLASHDCLLYSYLSTGEEWRFFDPGGRPVGVRIAGPMRANNGDALRHAARAGLGIVYSPAFLVEEDLAAGRLEPVLVDWRTPEAAVYAVYPPGRPLGAKVRVFVDYLAETLGRKLAATR